MKNTLFLAVMAGAALAGCVKNEPIVSGDGSPGRITFDAPVVSVPTRATEIANDYPNDKDFAVYALYHEGDFTSYDGSTVYMDNVQCVANKTGETETPDYWAPATDYYWPKTETAKLTFAAYAPANTNDVWGSATVAWNDGGFTFGDFTVQSEPDNQIDLLYSSRVRNQTASSMATDDPYDGVTIPFKHALTSVVFTAKATVANSITLTGIKVNNVSSKGTFNQNLTNDGDSDSENPGWTALADRVQYVVYSNATGTVLKTDEEAYIKDNDAVEFIGEDETVAGVNSNDGGKRNSNLIVIPQSLNDAGNEVSVTVTYKVTGMAAEQTQTFNLAVTPQGQAQTGWEMGKRYTYHITIGLNKIYFNPTVTDWTDVPGIAVES